MPAVRVDCPQLVVHPFEDGLCGIASLNAPKSEA
jgi:hypothetical protein